MLEGPRTGTPDTYAHRLARPKRSGGDMNEETWLGLGSYRPRIRWRQQQGDGADNEPQPVGHQSKDTLPPSLGYYRKQPVRTDLNGRAAVTCHLPRNGLGFRRSRQTNPLLHPRRGLSALSDSLRQFPLLTIMCQGYQEARFLALQEM